MDAASTVDRLTLQRRLAIATACSTFVLVLIGGLVHNTRSSLACPDWPLCFGTAFPKMVGGVFYEHSHRLAATTVGLLTIGLLIANSLRGRRLALLGVAALGLVIAQGVLGGITVIFRLPPLVSTAHLGLSLFFFCYLIYLSFEMRAPTSPPTVIAGPVRRFVLYTAVAVYVQCLLGALMRHLGAGLACVDLPLCRGAVWPSGEHPSVMLHATHRLFALVVGVLVVIASVRLWRATKRPLLKFLAVAMPFVVLLQIGLGVLSVMSMLEVPPVTAHLGGAALLLADLMIVFFATRTPEQAAVSALREPGAGIQPA
jgi:heme A synthase